jgi:SAM-dependent methyltransferase
MPKDKNEVLRAFLNAYWLRPETALWRTIDSLVLDDAWFQGPMLDLGCGDGIFSFLNAGGRFAPDFDAFRSTGSLDKFFDNADVYDHFDPKRVSPHVTRAPRYRFQVGLDHKESLIKKSATLGLYEDFVCHDGNQKLPFAAGTFQTVFSNILYWLDRPGEVFKEVARVLKPGGRLIALLPNDSLPKYSFYHRLHVAAQDASWKWLEKLDRGRLSSDIKHTYSRDQWTGLFQEAGLAVESHHGHLSKTVIEVWDIGLRPLFPALMKVVNKLNEADRAEMKADFVELAETFLAPLCERESIPDPGHPPAFHRFVVTKRD